MRYMIVDFDEKSIAWKDTLELTPESLNEGGSERYGDEYKETFLAEIIRTSVDEMNKREM